MSIQTKVLIRQRNYWSLGADLREARHNYKSLTGRFPTSQADIVSLTGQGIALDKIEVSDIDGNLWYPPTVSLTVIQRPSNKALLGR